MQDFKYFSIRFYYIFSTTCKKIRDLFCPVIFLDFRTVWPSKVYDVSFTKSLWVETIFGVVAVLLWCSCFYDPGRSNKIDKISRKTDANPVDTTSDLISPHSSCSFWFRATAKSISLFRLFVVLIDSYVAYFYYAEIHVCKIFF